LINFSNSCRFLTAAAFSANQPQVVLLNLRPFGRLTVYISEVNQFTNKKEIAAMFSSNFNYLVYKQQEQEYMREAEQYRMFREANKQSGASRHQFIQYIQHLAEKLSGLTRSITNRRPFTNGACCPAI
jgi:hypothetical protein